MALTVTGSGTGGVPLVDTDVTFVCGVTDGFPTSFTYTWFRDGAELAETSDTLVHSAVLADQGIQFKCSVDNGPFVVETALTLDIESKFGWLYFEPFYLVFLKQCLKQSFCLKLTTVAAPTFKFQCWTQS